MAVSAHDVLRELQHRLGGLSALKAQKLLYYVQGWHLAIDGRPAFAEEIQAWEKGPVVADVWHDLDKARPTPPPHDVDDSTSMVIDYVVSRYGHLSGEDLMHLTHNERPWKVARKRLPPRGGPISDDELRIFFTQDEEFERHMAEVRRLRERLDVFEFRPPHGDDVDAMIAAVLDGDRLDDLRP